MDGIRNWIEAEGAGHWFFIAFPVILLVLFIWFKGRRVRFLIPSFLISIVIINPIFYKYWDGHGLYAYWRILWVVPVIPVVAGLVPSITERIQNGWIKAIAVVVGVGVVVLSGTFLYNGAGGSFVEAANASKEPDYIVQIADRLLELDDKPRVIAQDPVGVYLRQYTGKIDQLFGRDIYGHVLIAGDDARSIHDTLNSGEIEEVAQFMADDDYDYLVYNGDVSDDFERIDIVCNYGIYRSLAKPSVIKERDELGRITSITTVDENGEPVENENNYARIEREYDVECNAVLERYLDKVGNLVVTGAGYAEVRRMFSGNKLLHEAYFNPEGGPLTQLAGHAAIQQEWKGNTLISRTYLDESGIPIVRSDGYTRVKWTRDEDNVWNIHFEDTDGHEEPIEGKNLIKDLTYGQDGWSDWMTPEYNVSNAVICISNINLGRKKTGELYTSHIEIEFKDVKATDGEEFHFWTQGSVDTAWDIGNVWDGSLILLYEVPKNDVYSFTCTRQLNDRMAFANSFDIGFRCDYWASGSFRIRNVKIEKGEQYYEWSPGL